MMTTPERWRIVKRLLADALERQPSERSAYLAQACTEASLRQEVESLIAAHEQTDGSFLDRLAEPPRLESGAKLGSYEIIALLGAGGMGAVYQAQDTKLPRQVALKLLPPRFANDADALLRFRREAELLASLSHPNIVTIYEIGQEGHTLYIVMEFVDGKVLSDVLTSGPMAIRDVFEVATQIVTGLAFAHHARIVHRDLKPKNIVIRQDGLVKILDFGLSKLAGPTPQTRLDQTTTTLTGPRTILGTVAYMSPQQAAGLPVDFRSDQFSCGSLLYEMATGKKPFEHGTAAQTLAAIIEDEPRAATSVNPQIPAALNAIIRRCLKKNPEERYASTDDLARELRENRAQAPRTTRARVACWAVPSVLALLFFLAAGGIWTIAPRLAEEIGVWPPSVRAAPAKQLAVLPFTNVGNDPASQPFCDGLVEILSSKLSQVEQFQKTLRVVPATDVVREGVVSVREAGQTFGVTLAITGSVQRTNNRVRITINLVDPKTLRQLKSKTIDTEVHDISTLQDGVVLEAADLLDVKLTNEARQVLAVGGTTVPDAYDLYAPGVGYLQRYDVAENVDHAISLFGAALQQDSRYPLAQAGLGEAYWRKYEQTKDPQWAEQAQKSSAAAIRLNDKLAPVYVTRGLVLTGAGDYDQAIGSFQRALVLDPLNADAYRGLAKAYEKLGKLGEAESTYRNAIVARPNYWDAHNQLGGFYFRQGRYAEAEKEFQAVVQLTPDNARGYSNLGAAAYAQRRYDEAVSLYEKSVAIKPGDTAYNNLGALYFTKRTAELAEAQLRVNPRDTDVLITLADSYSMLNRPQRPRQLLEKALALAPDDVQTIFQASVVYEQLGDRRRALEYLAKAIKGGYSRDLIENAPSLAQLRRDPRFQTLFGP